LKKYRITLPMPPTTNHYHVPRAGGKGLTKNPKVAGYQRDVIMLIRSMNLHKIMIDEPVRFGVVFHPKTGARYDVSNFLKAFEDGLQMAGFLADDHWIEYDFINKGEKDAKNPRVEIQAIVTNG
ncbi:endodeoxyribonuclease, partial [Vibrio phage 1.155.O._10N.222.55.B3]